MPLYTYRCDNCGVRFDRQQSYEDRPLTVCPECGKKAVHRVYRPVGIVFKGSGFYATDNRSGSASLTGGNGSGDSDSSEKSSGDKGDKKEASKKSDKSDSEKSSSSKD